MSFPRSPAIAFALLAAVPLSAAAGERTPFEIVAGWEVERDRPEAEGNACLMSRSDKDKDDAENAVVFKRFGADGALVLGYGNWEWSTDERIKVPFVIGAKVATLKPQDAALEQELRAKAAKKPPDCPDSPDMQAKYRTNIREPVEMSPEAYLAQMEKRMAKRQRTGGGTGEGTAGTGSNATQP